MQMKTSETDQTLGKVLLATLVIVTTSVSPWNSVDPINLPKMVGLGILSFTVLGLLVSKKRLALITIDLRLLILSFAFLAQFFAAALVISGDLAFKVYGTPHRNTGLLTYFCLTIILLASANIAKTTFPTAFLYTLIGTAAILSAYGLAQSQGKEFLNYTTTSSVFSTFGNPNFHSAFMGRTQKKTRVLLVCVFFLCGINIFLSSSQGFLVLVAGLCAAILARLFSARKYFIGLVMSLLCILGLSAVTLGVFNQGPLAGLIYENSLKARGFYWDAAFQMSIANPFFGVGVDGFGDWYLRFRSEDAAAFNAQLVSDSAHNIFLDLSTSGGILLFAAYTGIQILVAVSVIKRVRSQIEIDGVYLSLFAGWIAYQVQSLISINQIGLAVWGWALSGMLIGVGHIDQSGSSSNLKPQRDRAPKLNQKLTRSAKSFLMLGLFFGLLVSVPPYSAANKFYKGMQSGQIQQLAETADLNPKERTRYYYVSQILMENNSEREAIPILQEASVRYPDYYPIWYLWAKNSKATPDQIAKARAEMQRLDPLNPEWK
jgi:O-antigen ligase